MGNGAVPKPESPLKKFQFLTATGIPISSNPISKDPVVPDEKTQALKAKIIALQKARVEAKKVHILVLLLGRNFLTLTIELGGI